MEERNLDKNESLRKDCIKLIEAIIPVCIDRKEFNLQINSHFFKTKKDTVRYLFFIYISFQMIPS